MPNYLTGVPFEDDVSEWAVPVCAPYSAVKNYKFRAKIIPGPTKKGKGMPLWILMLFFVILNLSTLIWRLKHIYISYSFWIFSPPFVYTSTFRIFIPAAQTVIFQFLKHPNITETEKNLIKIIPESDYINQMIGNVKVCQPKIQEYTLY